jgi:hypothetical protein
VWTGVQKASIERYSFHEKSRFFLQSCLIFCQIPAENKFAVGSASKVVCVCHYDSEHDWFVTVCYGMAWLYDLFYPILCYLLGRWVAKLIKKGHSSSVTGVAWHPNNVSLLQCHV